MVKKKVFVGLSGGVDSSVAALRLKQAGFDVVGVFIKVWHPDFLVCNWEQERLDAMRVAAHLDIPFLTCDAEAAYRDEVATYFISEYKAGRTPNPDVMCNQYVKFGAFIKFAKERGADYIATGHYAQKIHTANSNELTRGIDSNKDQSYFLWALTAEQLNFALFPVGNTTKEEIRKEAAKARIPTAAKKDSQGICFLGQVDIKDFLSHYVDLQPGPVYDEAGACIGSHTGALVYTIGQRHGFTITVASAAREAYYVTEKNIETNSLTVSTIKPTLSTSSSMLLHSVVLRSELTLGGTYEAQTRYRQQPFKVRVDLISNDQLALTLEETTDAVAQGQSCVLYDHAVCIGGGIIS